MKKNCLQCGKPYPRRGRGPIEYSISKFCGHTCARKYFHEHNSYAPSPHADRNQYIVDQINNGGKAINIAKKLNISRERVRQIYTHLTGEKGTRMVTHTIQAVKKYLKEKEEGNVILFYCVHCKTPVRKKDRYSGTKLCRSCREEATGSGRTYYVVNTCVFCGQEYHPFRNNKKQRYCSQNCYHQNGGRPSNFDIKQRDLTA